MQTEVSLSREGRIAAKEEQLVLEGQAHGFGILEEHRPNLAWVQLGKTAKQLENA